MKIISFLLTVMLFCGCGKNRPPSTFLSSYEKFKSTNVVERFYKNGRRYEYGNFVDDSPVGVHKMWDKNGSLVSSGIYSNGRPWHGTFYIYGAGDWYETYTNGVECDDMPIPDGLSNYHIMLYKSNNSYAYKDYIYENDWRGMFCLSFDWSDFSGFLNYEESEGDEKTLPNVIDGDAE